MTNLTSVILPHTDLQNPHVLIKLDNASGNASMIISLCHITTRTKRRN